MEPIDPTLASQALTTLLQALAARPEQPTEPALMIVMASVNEAVALLNRAGVERVDGS